MATPKKITHPYSDMRHSLGQQSFANFFQTIVRALRGDLDLHMIYDAGVYLYYGMLQNFFLVIHYAVILIRQDSTSILQC